MRFVGGFAVLALFAFGFFELGFGDVFAESSGFLFGEIGGNFRGGDFFCRVLVRVADIGGTLFNFWGGRFLDGS